MWDSTKAYYKHSSGESAGKLTLHNRLDVQPRARSQGCSLLSSLLFDFGKSAILREGTLSR
jgi:hypothetical protein